MGTFTGEVTGCGKNGSFLYNGLRTDTAPDRSEATYLIIPGTGTGDLDGISGVMQQHAARRADHGRVPLRGPLIRRRGSR